MIKNPFSLLFYSFVINNKKNWLPSMKKWCGSQKFKWFNGLWLHYAWKSLRNSKQQSLLQVFFLQFWTIFSLTFVKHNGIIYFSYTKKSILVFARSEWESEWEKENRRLRKMLCKDVVPRFENYLILFFSNRRLIARSATTNLDGLYHLIWLLQWKTDW